MSKQKAFIQFKIANGDGKVVDVIRKYFKKAGDYQEYVYDCRGKLFKELEKRYGTNEEEYDVVEIWEQGFKY